MKMLRELNQVNIVAQLTMLYEELVGVEKTIVEAYRLARNLPMDQLVHMVDVAKRALELAAQLREDEQEYHMDRIGMILQKVQNAITRRKKATRPDMTGMDRKAYVQAAADNPEHI